MPYEYRKLSPKEREEVVNHRRAHGYPLHAPPHPFRATVTYLISAANFEHQPVMDTPMRRTEFEVRLVKALQEITDDLIAWVVLPNHYHALVAVQSLNDISLAIKQLHGRTSHDWNLEDHVTGKRRVWYKFADTYIRSDVHLHTAFNYIHYNPVKHGYVSTLYDWPWSSVLMYSEEKGKDFLEKHWLDYQPPADFGKGWDEEVKND